ncbi:hypothetical protein FRB93_013317 [Tulasnella sp. JGI-2019a]|nr:hypothetical protein FRB93_013317 [Tulasnella sp. JGI-2019a]
MIDDDEYLIQPSLSMDAGTIRVTVKRVRDIQYVPCRGAQDRVHDLRSVTVHERSKKAGGHVVQQAPEKAPTVSGVISLSPYVPADKNPYVTFIFRYRPVAILQTQGIMPAPELSRAR